MPCCFGQAGCARTRGGDAMDLTTAVAEEYRLLKKTAATVDPFTFYARVADRLGYDPPGKKNAALLYAVMKKVPLAEVFRRHGAEKGISYCKKRFADAASRVSSEEYERFLRIFAYAEDPATYPPPGGAARARGSPAPFRARSKPPRRPRKRPCRPSGTPPPPPASPARRPARAPCRRRAWRRCSTRPRDSGAA